MPNKTYDPSDTIEVTDLAEYNLLHKKPYTADYFEVGDYLDLPTYQKYIDTVENYILSEIDTNNLENSIDSYSSLINELLDSIKARATEKGTSKLERIAKWIEKVIKPSQEIELKKKKILGND